MTWKDFKIILESRGVKDEDEINYIDVGNYGSDGVYNPDEHGAHFEHGPEGWEIA